MSGASSTLGKITSSNDEAACDDVMAALASYANAHLPVLSGLFFTAQPPDTSLQDAPTYSVTLHNADGHLVATYKYNYFRDDDTSPAIWRFFPLVIQWAEDGAHRTSGMDVTIIEHCLLSLRGFFAQRDGRYAPLMMASGYLTTQRHGRAFFERMGWQLYSFGKVAGAYPALAALPPPLQKTALRIDEISMPFRTDDVEANTLCFAVIDL